MIDIKLIRKDVDTVEKKIHTKDPSADVRSVFDLDIDLRTLKHSSELLKSRSNELSKEIGERKRKKESIEDLMQEANDLNDKSRGLEEKLRITEEDFQDALVRLPNIPSEEAKVSLDPKENVVIKMVKEKPEFSFPFKNHLELNEGLGLFDFKKGAEISGAGWPIYKGMGARLEWALINYMLSIHIKNGFTQWMVPLLVRKNVMFGSGQLPKFDNQQFKIQDDDFNLYMIPTAEVPLNSIHAGEILKEDELPLKYVAYTPCFRREAGAAGSQERGLIRTHQFNKVEMFCFTKPEDSVTVFDQMMQGAEEILEGLGLHYRNMLLVTGDMSFAAAKTVDIEVWLPGQNRYYEVSSVSNCTDYQSRRSMIRYRKLDGSVELVHTLNGSGLATSRLMVALLENNQNEDGSVNIPAVLQPFLGGITKLVPNK